MAKDPAFLFYSQDFIVGVQILSFEDRGKYITILAQMHQQGRLSEETICFLVGSVSVQLKSKFSIDSNGNWYNERLESETEKRNNYTESRRSNGLKGGRPRKEEKHKVNHKDNHMGNHMENENINTISKNNIDCLLFEKFWNIYDKKVGLAKSRKIWDKLKKDDIDKILTHVPRYVAATPDKTYRKNPLTYLNGKCWMDDIIVPISIKGNRGAVTDMEEIKRLMAE